MPEKLYYWDEAGQAFVSLGVKGPVGVVGTTGPVGPAGVIPTDDGQQLPLSWKVGSAPPAGTRLRLHVASWVVTSGVFSEVFLAIPAYTYGYSAFAMMGEGTPTYYQGICQYQANCTLSQFAMLAYKHNNGLIQSTMMRFNIVFLGA